MIWWNDFGQGLETAFVRSRFYPISLEYWGALKDALGDLNFFSIVPTCWNALKTVVKRPFRPERQVLPLHVLWPRPNVPAGRPLINGRIGGLVPPDPNPTDYYPILPPIPTIELSPTKRFWWLERKLYILAWPSRGGLIVLEDADAVDLEYLGLDPTDLPPTKFWDALEEDAFCRRVLLLGAKWYDNEWRALWILENHFQIETYNSVELPYCQPKPDATIREKRWVKVGWPSGGGLWVSEFDTDYFCPPGLYLFDNELEYHEQTRRLRLTRTMDERCKVLRDHLKGRFYDRVEDYHGHAFINSWDTHRETGEVGPLLTPKKTWEVWMALAEEASEMKEREAHEEAYRAARAS